MKTVLVTGGAGFIGSHIVETLLEKRFRVVCVDNFDDAYDPALKRENVRPFSKNKNFTLQKIDIRDRAKLERLFKKERPEAVVHMAARGDARAAVENAALYIDVNVVGTLNVLECSRLYGVKKVILASSSSVYGNQNKPPFSEDALSDLPLSPYGASKKSTEVLAYSYYHNFGLPVACLRIFNAYGERMRPNLVLYKWTENILAGKTVELSGKGTRTRDFTYVKDIVDAVLRCLKTDFGYEILNLGVSKPVSLSQLLKTVERATGVKAAVTHRASNRASVEQTHASPKKAKRLLGWEAKTSLEDGVSKFVSWFRNERA